MTDTTYALVDKQAVLLYPLTIEDINTRDNPMETYYKCYQDIEPAYDPLTQIITHVPMVIGEAVYVIHRVEDKDLDTIFAQLNAFIADQLANSITPSIQSLPNGMLGSIMQLTVKRVQESLDEFAKTRGYDDIRSVCTYVNSTNTKFNEEGSRAVVLRDQTWDSLYTFLGTVGAGGIPYPFTWSVIQAVLPELTWGD